MPFKYNTMTCQDISSMENGNRKMSQHIFVAKKTSQSLFQKYTYFQPITDSNFYTNLSVLIGLQKYTLIKTVRNLQSQLTILYILVVGK